MDWHPELMQVTRRSGIQAGIDFLDSKRESADVAGLRDILNVQIHFALVASIVESTREGRLLLLERFRRIVAELEQLPWTDLEERRAELRCAYGSMLECCLHLGPCEEFRGFAAPALLAARSLPLVPKPGADYMERELQDRFMLRVALVACALGEDRLAGEVFPLVSSAFLDMDPHLLKLLEPFGRRLPG